jgi:hypothetical protein
MSKAERAVGMVNRLAQLFGEVNAGSNPISAVKMNSEDLDLLCELGYIKIRANKECTESKGYMWGAEFSDDETLLPGTAVIGKFGKRMLV